MKASVFAAVGALALVLVVPALADDSPSVAACKAEYQQLGQAGFAAKYGAGEAGYKACVQAHGGTAPTPPAQNGDSGPAAACKAEYQQLGASGFAAKYGAGEAGYKTCFQAHGGTIPTTPPASGGDSGALAACKAEYQQLGASGFAAKYGTGETGLKACVRAHGGTVPTTPPASGGDSGAVAACKTEYQQLGASGFAAKYGANEPYRACIQAHGGTPPPPGPGNGEKKPDLATGIAGALCAAEAKSLGKDGFQSKYGNGKDGLSACVHAQAAKAQSIVAACKASAGSSADAFKQCVYAAVKSGAR